MPEDKFLLIRHADGREYAVRESRYHEVGKDDYEGFRVVGYQDGTEYRPPKPEPKQEDKAGKK